MSYDSKPGKVKYGDQFVIIGGDGNQDFLQEKQILRLTNADWFPGVTHMSGGEPALLFIIEGGRWSGQYLVLSPRGGPVEKQFELHGNASVVLELVRNPTSSFRTDVEDQTYPLAMGMVKKIT